jgi:hypothetical protein
MKILTEPEVKAYLSQAKISQDLKEIKVNGERVKCYIGKKMIQHGERYIEQRWVGRLFNPNGYTHFEVFTKDNIANGSSRFFQNYVGRNLLEERLRKL